MIGRETLRRGVRWLRSRWRDRDLILLYHRIAEPEQDTARDPYRLCVSSERFAQQLEAIRGLARAVPLTEIAFGLEAGAGREGRIAVTFDDGYADIPRRARPLLEKYEVPATVFAVSGSLGTAFWWDRLTRAVLGARRLPDRLSLGLGGREHVWRIEETGPRSGRRLLSRLYPLLRSLDEPGRRSALQELESQVGLADAADEDVRSMTAEELVLLAGSGLVEVGAHGVSHQPLGMLQSSEQRSEVFESKAQLEGLLGRGIHSFSYPYGQARDVGVESARLVREAGFRCACTTTVDVVLERSHPYRLPRLWVGDWSGSEFLRRIGRWLGV